MPNSGDMIRHMRATAARRTATWALAHAPAKVLFGRQARRGNPMARLITDPAARLHPEPLWEEIRGRGDLVRGKLSWATVSQPVVGRVLRGEEFTSMFPEPGNAIGQLYRAVRDPWALGPAEPPSLLAIDAPDHTRLRRLVSRAFTARRVAGLEAGIEKTTRALLDAMEMEDRVDLVDRFAATLPVTVIADLLGVLPEERAPLLSWGNDAALLLDAGLPYRTFTRAQRGVREMHQWVHHHIERLRAEPGDDVISTVIRQADDLPEEDRPSPEELRLLALLVLGAGFETTVNLIGNAVVLLDRHPDQRDLLRSEPDRWPLAVEEVLRFDSPVQLTGRMARQDVEVAGTHLPRGSGIVMFLGGAHRDPDVFRDPNTFDVTRENAGDHLAFSAGPHYCLGAQLARLETAVGLRALYERFPGLRLEGEPVRHTTQVLRGWSSVPVRLR
jgi:cytochrome P450